MFSKVLRAVPSRTITPRSQRVLSTVLHPRTSAALHPATTQKLKFTNPRHGELPLLSRAHNYSTDSSNVHLTAEPPVCMHDVHTTLTVRGLPPSEPVTLRAFVYNDNNKKFCSHAQYVANDRGEVFVDTDASVGGSYTGVFPAGLLTTLKPAPGEFRFLRLMKKNPKKPFEIDISVHAGHHAVSADTPPDLLTSVRMTRLLMAPGVQRQVVREGRLRGVLYTPPPHYGPAVGVVDMFGAVGGLVEFRAAMLASRGYAVLSLPFFGYEDLPAVPDVLDLEYFEDAARFVMAQDNVIPDRCGMISVSKSSDIAMVLSTRMPELTGVVCIGVIGVSYDTQLNYRGKVVSEGNKLSGEDMMADDQGRLYPKKNLISDFLVKKPLVPIEKASPDCHYLMVAGSDDAWHCYLTIPRVREHMKQHHRSDRYEGIIYPGAGHLIEPPYGPLLNQSYQRMFPVQKFVAPENLAFIKHNPADMPGGVQGNYVTGVPILFGGQPKETCDAQEDLWVRMQRFLDKSVKHNSPWYQQHLLDSTKSESFQERLTKAQ